MGAYQMWVIAANDYVIEWRLRVSSVVVPSFSNSTPCFVWIQGQRGSALVSLAQSKTLAWPPPPSPDSRSQSLPLVFLMQTQSLVFDIIFFSLRGVQRGESQFVKQGGVMSCCCSSAEYSLEVVCMFQKGSRWEWRGLEWFSAAVTKCIKKVHVFSLTSLYPLYLLFLPMVLTIRYH